MLTSADRLINLIFMIIENRALWLAGSLAVFKMAARFFDVSAQANQTHVPSEGCNVIYIKIMWRAVAALQTTVANIRDFLYEKYITETGEH